MTEPLRVVDICCGAGEFSEGFRQAGFNIILGVDTWGTALQSFKTKSGGQKRTKIVRDHAGKIIGKRANVKVTTRKGDKLYIKNIKTGKKSWIKLYDQEG